MATSETAARSSFNETFGDPKETTANKVKARLTPYVQEFIKLSPFAVLASADADGHCDASPKGGKPGFVTILDEHHLLFPDVAGNKLFQSYQNLEANPQVGLIFMIPGINETVRVNGKAVIVDKEELDRRHVQVALHNPGQRWYYFPWMQADEALLFKTFDSETDGRARFTIHTSFEDPDAPADAPPRESIETRCLVFF